MNIKHYTEPFYHIIIDDIFSDKVLSEIFKEIEILKTEFKLEKFTFPAKDFDGKILKKNKGIFLCESKFYKSLKIINYLNNILDKVCSDKDWKNKTLHRMCNSIVWGGDLLNYYSCGDYYKPHCDDGIFSMITFFYKNYDKCEDGNLYFPEYNHIHKCKNNQSIIFLSTELHGVTELKSSDTVSRYSIVKFSTHQPQGKITTTENKYGSSINFNYF